MGFGDLGHVPWSFHPKRFQGRIYVDKTHQNRGIGQFIYENLMSFASGLQAEEFWGYAREDMPVSLAFLAKRGFRERLRSWESRLSTATVNISQFSRYLEKASNAGVEISSLSRELEVDQECYKKLYHLSQTLMADVPSPFPYTPVSYEQWHSFDMKDPGLLPDVYAIAKHGADYVGLSSVRRLDKEPHGLYQVLTGVRREYRGKGIAFAMKLKVIERAQRQGYDLIKTENATDNEAIIGINVKLGFQRQTGWVDLSKTL